MRLPLLLLALVAALAIPASASAADVTPILVTSSNNPGCADIPNADPDWVEFKPHESTPPGTYAGTAEETDGTLTVEFTVNPKDAQADPPKLFETVDWTSNIGVDAVIIKATNAGNAFVYQPPGDESTGDTGLYSPVAGGSGTPADVSHVKFCYDTNDPDPDPCETDPNGTDADGNPCTPPTDPCETDPNGTDADGKPCTPPTTQDPPPTITQNPPPAPLVAAAPLTAAPVQQVAAQRAASGNARLSGPARCVRARFSIRVSGSQIASVTFYRGNKRVGSVRATAGKRVFTGSIAPKGGGVQNVRAVVRFTTASGTRAKTLRAKFRRCVLQAARPQFTG